MEEFEFQYYTPSQFHHTLIQNSTSNGSQQSQQQQQQQQQTQQQFVQFNPNTQQKQNDSRCNSKSNQGQGQMVFSMDRLSPYGSYQDDSRSTNLSNLTLDQIFKSNQTDDQSNIVVVNGNNTSILLFQQPQQQQQQQQQNQQQQQGSTSSSPSNTSISPHSSSPQSSSSPSSTNDTTSNYGTTFIFKNNLPMTPPSDTNGSNNLLSDFKVESLQLLDCGLGQQQNQMQHHQSPTLVSLVPPTASTLNPLLNPMMNIISPSKPTNISELSNSSMVSSSSSSTLDSNQYRSNVQTPTRTRNRNSSSKTANESSSKDGKYLERRKRNNVAAKKSRDARKQREDEIAIRASYLEKENSVLKAQLQTLKDEAQQLRALLTQKKTSQSMGGLMTSSCANCSNCMSKQISTNYVPNLTNMSTGYDTDQTINLVDQKLSNNTTQNNPSSTNSIYLGQPHQTQMNRLL
ncbi:unnamed protein product [Brachionus calyciflorus]|uniref:BZIP domain-containing protein n=1 Tax=Brachionus calyciflorus TaxID=104777 RepID=A0A814DVN1_9BILA|nr:unnamed protein product [Brachionus calyciflorus]